jgi:hypothetical protein
MYICVCALVCKHVYACGEEAVEGIYYSLLKYSQKDTPPEQSCQEAVSIHHYQVYLNIAVLGLLP